MDDSPARSVLGVCAADGATSPGERALGSADGARKFRGDKGFFREPRKADESAAQRGGAERRPEPERERVSEREGPAKRDARCASAASAKACSGPITQARRRAATSGPARSQGAGQSRQGSKGWARGAGSHAATREHARRAATARARRRGAAAAGAGSARRARASRPSAHEVRIDPCAALEREQRATEGPRARARPPRVTRRV